MPLNSSGPISIGGSTVGQSVNLELGRSATTSSNLNESALRTLTGIPSGPISLYNFYATPFSDYFSSISLLSTTQGQFECTAIDSNQNYYGVGRFYNPDKYGYSTIIAKFSSTGSLVWQRLIDNSTLSVSHGGIVITYPGDDIYVGFNVEDSTSKSGIIKFDVNGNVVWKRLFSHQWGSNIGSVALSKANNLYLYYSEINENTGSFVQSVASIDSSGNILWQKSYFIDYINNQSKSAVADQYQNLYLLGRHGSTPSLIKLNSSGVVQWAKTISILESVESITVDTVGDIYVIGNRYLDSVFDPAQQAVLIKINSSGVLQWSRSIAAPTAIDFKSLSGLSTATDQARNVYAAGGFSVDGKSEGFITKFDTNGSLLWQRKISGTSSAADGGLSHITSQFGKIYCSGVMKLSGGLQNQMMATVFSQSGNEIATYQSVYYNTSNLITGSITPVLQDISGINTLTTANSPIADSFLTITTSSLTLTTLQSYWLATLSPSTIGLGVQVDSQKNVYAAGDYSAGNQYGNFLIKYNNSGVVQWKKQFGSNSVGVDALATAPDGTCYTTENTSNNLHLTKFNSSGVLQWTRMLYSTVGPGLTEGDSGIALDSSGNPIVVVLTNSAGYGNYDSILAKYNTSGVLQWQQRFGTDGSDTSTAVALDLSDNIYVSGQYTDLILGGSDAYVAKFNSSGILQWARKIGGSGTYDYFYRSSIAVTPAGDVYCCGTTNNVSGGGGYEIFIVKYNTSGAIQWQRATTGSSNDEGSGGVCVDSSGNVYVAGYSITIGNGSSDIPIIKFNSSGDVIWKRRLGVPTSSTWDEALSITADNSGSIYLTGYTGVGGLIAKFPSDGSLTGATIGGGFTYSDSTIGVVTTTLPDSALSLSATAGNLTDTAATYNSTDSPQTSTTYYFST